MKNQKGKSTLLIVLVAIVAVVVGLMVQSVRNRPIEMPELSQTILLPTPKIIDAVGLLDHHGQPFGLDRMQGRWTVLFFGFTNCPDICPTTMHTLSQVKRQLASAGVWHNYQVVMVSVDPERDSQQRLANYVPYYDAEFIGVSGSVEDTQAFARQLGILFVKREVDENGAYEVDHGASMILVNPQGRYAGVITAPHQADSISQDLIKLAEYQGVEPQAAAELPAASNTPAASAKPAQKPLSAAPSTQDLSIGKAWIRPAAPGVNSMAAYFSLRNNSNRTIEIVESSSSAFAATMIHDTVIEDGVASMQHLDGLEIAANSTKILAPMATHMMLMQPVKPLVLGDSVDLTLIDSKQVRYTYQIEVREPNGE